MPIEPASILASSVRMSPNIFSVTITSKSAGRRSRCMAQASTSIQSNCRSANSSRMTRVVTLRQRRLVSSTLALSTRVSLPLRPRASSAAARTTRTTSASV